MTTFWDWLAIGCALYLAVLVLTAFAFAWLDREDKE